MKIVSVEQMRSLEAAAFVSGISEAQLQEQAGQAVAQEVFATLRDRPGRVVVMVGHGNNGRDGAVATLWLLRHNVAVDLVLTPRHALAADELGRLREAGAGLVGSNDHAAINGLLSGASLVVDALAGIGTHGPLREPLASLAGQINSTRQGLHVLALDIPSGIDADTGEVPGESVWADSTVTLGAVKQGLLRFPAASQVGRLIPRALGIPSSAEADIAWSMLEVADLRECLPPRALDAHKYRFGRVLVLAGSDHFLGAPVLCAGGAARVGAGLVTVGSTDDVRRNVAAHLPEATFTATCARAEEGASAAQAIESYLKSHNALVLGPGLGRGPGTTEFVAEVLRLRDQAHAIVVDADALVALAALEDWPQRLGANAVLTPHSGELERLVGRPLDAAETDWQRAARLASEWGCVLVSKGPFTSIARPDGRVDVWPLSNPALATGGTGDVLAGLTGGLLAQGLHAFDAGRLAVGIHGLAAQRVVTRRGWRTLLASDLFEEIPAILGDLATGSGLTPPR
jgi:NAD(P)H-hydrate epimerase